MKLVVIMIELLQSILESEHSRKAKLINEFQEIIWNGENIQDEVLNEILLELAYDLDFYEPNEKWRKESQSYYDDAKLKIVIETAILKLQRHSHQ